MNRILILYSSREGHTERIAQYLRTAARAYDLAAEVVDSAHLPEGFAFGGYSAAIVAASVHRGRHGREIVEFVRRHIRNLERMPSAFVSVSLTAAGAQDATASPEKRAHAATTAKSMLEAFLSDTGWRPTLARSVAGALLYTQYNWFLRWVMKSIARKSGGATDTSSDWDYTNWAALDWVVAELCTLIPKRLIPEQRFAADCPPASSESVLR